MWAVFRANILFVFAVLLRVGGVRKESDEDSDGELASCTPRDQDPFQTGAKVACCSGLIEKLGTWSGDGRHHYLCKASDEDSDGEPVSCTPRDKDPFQTGAKVACCSGLIEKLGTWSGGGKHHYLCKAPVDSAGCLSQWDNKACQGQFGNEECYTCGERIEWLESKGSDEKLARQQVATTFVSQCGKCAPEGGGFTISKEGYSLVWADEFNGDSIDTKEWKLVQRGDGFGNNELQYYTNRGDNAWVSDGTLKIKAKWEKFQHRNYTSAKLETHKDWMYGKFHVRARLKQGTGRGTWAAQWMLPRTNKYGIWPRSGEIDIFEHVGYDTGVVHGTVHTQAYHHHIGTQKGGSIRGDVKDWHTYTVEWRPELMLFAMDDQVYQIFKKESDTDKDKWPFDMSFFLILNMAVGGNWGGQKGIDESAFRGEGQIMEVDWVRVEQKGATGTPRPAPATPAPTPTPEPPTSTPAPSPAKPVPTPAPEPPTSAPAPVCQDTWRTCGMLSRFRLCWMAKVRRNCMKSCNKCT